MVDVPEWNTTKLCRVCKSETEKPGIYIKIKKKIKEGKFSFFFFFFSSLSFLFFLSFFFFLFLKIFTEIELDPKKDSKEEEKDPKKKWQEVTVETRDLRRCTGCHRILNRDRNGATNILSNWNYYYERGSWNPKFLPNFHSKGKFFLFLFPFLFLFF